MRLTLPDFSNTDCRYFSVCLRGEAGEGEALAKLGAIGDQPMTAGYNSASGRANIRLHAYQPEDNPHCHIDILLGRSMKLRSTHRKERIFSVLADLFRSEWSSQPKALFVAGRERAGDFYSALGRKLELNSKAEIEMTGVELSFTKTPVVKLSVSVGNAKTFVDILGRRTTVELTEDYFLNLLNGLDKFYKAFTEGAGQ